MFIVYLKLGAERARASEFMAKHLEWIQRGIDDEVFLCAGSLPDQKGGVIIACGLERDALQERLADDPFVEQGVVDIEITPIAVGKTAAKARFLAD